MKKTYCILLLSVVCVLMGYAQDDRQLIREGNKLYRSGQYAQAETTYRKALGKNSQNVRATYNLGCALMKQGKTEEADKMFTQAGSSGTDTQLRSKAYYNKGVMYHSKKDYEKAIDAYKNALRLNPSDEQARKNLALCKRQQQKQKQQQQNNQDQKDQKDQKDKDEQQKNQQDKNKDQQDKQQPEKKDEMSKENAEQLLNAAMQEEKATQQRLKKAMQQPSNRNLDKNW